MVVADPLRFYTSVNDRAGAEARLADVLRSVVGDVLSSYSSEALLSDPLAEGSEASSEGGPDMQDVNEAMTREAASRAAECFGVRVAAVRISASTSRCRTRTPCSTA